MHNVTKDLSRRERSAHLRYSDESLVFGDSWVARHRR